MASANIHKAPSTASPVIAAAPRGQSFEVTRELGSWVAIPWPTAENGVGYLHVTWGRLSRGGEGDPSRAGGAPAATPPPTTESASSVEDRRIGQQPGRSTTSSVPLPSHIVGVGGGIGTRARSGVSAIGRLWVRQPVGAQLEFGRAAYGSVSLQRMTVTDVGFNAITSLSDVVTSAVWMRPYLGGGISVVRSTLRSTSGVSIATDTRRAYQAFGGAEFTWANVPPLAVSADLRQVWAPTPFGTFETGGLGLALTAHWYIR